MNPIESQALALQSLRYDKSVPHIVQSDGTAEGDAKLRQACEDFEAMFIKMMLDSMRKTVVKSDLLEEGMSGEMFQDLLYDEYSKVMAKNGSFGVSDILYSQLSGTQSVLKRPSYR